jgi:hypothetical protein
MAHEETDFFDEIERELVALTTAGLVEETPQREARLQPAFPPTTKLKTVILAKARTHTT